MTSSPAFHAGRRALLPRAKKLDQPPPWTNAQRLAESCIGCSACMLACPEGIIVAQAPGGIPAVDFAQGECTFCGACSAACDHGVFSDPLDPPWGLRAAAAETCLARTGVVCQACKDACATDAIRFTPVAGRVARPSFDLTRCTGCGACAAPCPVGAITLREPEVVHAAG